jgi:hypothetical protein
MSVSPSVAGSDGRPHGNYAELVVEEHTRSSHCKPLPVRSIRWVLGIRPEKCASSEGWHEQWVKVPPG